MSDSASHLADLPLSVLDLAPVGRGSTPADALRNSIALVQETERLGYHRHWVAEHHNMPGIASSSPAVLLAHLASVTSTIRLGSGGVMLPNHSALTVAEQFGMLEALHPGRIDLGIGRAPGTDQLTAAALRRGPELLGADDFPEQMTELIGYFEGALPEGHRYERITAVPGPRLQARAVAARVEHLRRVGRGRARPAVLVRLPLRARPCSTTRSRSTGATSVRRPISTRPT